MDLGYRELLLDRGDGDHLLRVERGEAADEVLELAHIAWPAMALQPLHGRRVDLLARQAFPLDQSEEVADEVRHVLGALAQRRQANAARR